ncbi:unnamed protein product [Amoebophrya sp. A120]|nr:unnamed protein product [Amoebophrya sp. A120]|eukprot:GSA120T00021516001.1
MLHAPDLPLGAGVVSPQVEVQELKQRMNLARALALKKIPKVQDDSDDRAMNRARAASLPPQPHYRAGDHHNNELQAAGNKDKHHRVTGAAHPRHSGQRRSHQQHHSLTKLQGAGGGRAAGAAGPPRNYSESRTSSPLQDRLAQNGLGVGSPKRSKDDTFLGLLEPDEIPGEDEEKMFHPLMASPKQWGRKYVPRWASTYDTVVAEGANSDELVKYTVSTTTGELLFKHNAKQASATRPRRSVDDIHLSAPQLLHPRSAWFGTRAHGLAPGRVVSNRVGVMFNSTTALTPEQQLQQAKEVDLEQVPAMKNYAVGSDLALGPGEQTLLQQMPPGAMRAKDPARYPFTRGGPVNLAEDGFGMLTRNSRSHSPVQQGARVGQHGQEPHRNKKHPHSNLMHHGGQSGVQQLHSNDDSENNDPARGRRSSFPSGVHQDRFKRWKLNKFAGAQSRLHVVPKHRASTPDRKSVGLLLGEEEDNSEVVPVMQGPRASTGAAAGAGKINFEDGGNKELVPQQAGAVVDLTSLALQVNDQVVAQRNLSRRKSAPGGAKGRTTKGRARSRGGAAGVLAASRRKASKEKNEVALASSSPNSRSGSLDSKKKNYAVTEEQDNVVSYESRTAGGVQIQEPAGAKMLSNSSSKDVGATRYTEMNRQLVDKLLTVLDNELLDADRDSQTGTAAQFRCDDAPRELQARPSPVNYTATANGGNAKRNSKQSTSKRNFHSRAQKLVPALDMQQVPSALEDEDETENLDEMAAGEDEQQPIDQLSKTGGGTNSATILGPQQSPAVGQLRFQAKPLIAPQLFVGIPVDTSQQEPVVLANGSPLRQLPTATSCTTTPAGMILSTSSPLVHPASVVVPALQMQPVSTTTTTMLPGGGTLTTMASGAGISRINGAIAPAPGPTPVTVNSSNMLTRLAPPRIVEYNH